MKNFKITFARLVLLVAVALLSSNHRVDCQCTDLIQQYFECKYLKMTNNTKSYIPAYVPDPSIPNNTLNDTFYQNQNLSRMNFDQAMKLFWNIYNETNNCNTTFCDCVSKGVIDKWDSKVSLLFRNASIFAQMKIIVSSFINKFKPYRLPYSQLQLQNQFPQTPNLTTLNQFCINYDYSLNQFNYLNNTETCIYPVDQFECEWSAKVVNKKFSFNYTNSQMANLLSCNLLSFKKCPIQQKRLVALSNWYGQFPAMTFPWKNLPAYLDTLISRADTFKPKINFIYNSFFSWYPNIIIMSNKTQYTYNTSNKSDLTAMAFNSTQLRIDCRFTLSSQQINVEWFNFTFIFDKTHSINRFINISLLTPALFNSSFSNGTVVKDKNGQNWIQIYYYYFGSMYSVSIYDLNSNSFILFSSSGCSLFTPSTLLQKANGFMKNGMSSNYIISFLPT